MCPLIPAVWCCPYCAKAGTVLNERWLHTGCQAVPFDAEIEIDTLTCPNDIHAVMLSLLLCLQPEVSNEVDHLDRHLYLRRQVFFKLHL